MKTKKTYDTGKALSIRLSLGWWVLDPVHCLLVILSSLYAVWPIPINEIAALTGGSVILGVGVVLMLAGMTEFRSIGRISGSDTSQLVTTGIYHGSRNPQYLGWFLVLLGISVIGSSGLALLYTTIGIVLFHVYITQLEEPYLRRLFGEKYLSYKTRTPRYFGVPKKKSSTTCLKLNNRCCLKVFNTERTDWYLNIPTLRIPKTNVFQINKTLKKSNHRQKNSVES